MKKQMYVLLVLCVLISAVFVVGQGEVKLSINQVMEKIRTMSHIRASNVEGLQNAQLRVRDEEVAKNIEMVMNKINNQTRQRMQLIDGLTIGQDEESGKIYALGTEETRLLGLFRVRRRVQYELTNNGDIIRQRQFFDFIHKYADARGL